MEGDGTCFRANPRTSLVLTRQVACRVSRDTTHRPRTILEPSAFKLLALFLKMSLPNPSCFAQSGFLGREALGSWEGPHTLLSRPFLSTADPDFQPRNKGTEGHRTGGGGRRSRRLEPKECHYSRND